MRPRALIDQSRYYAHSHLTTGENDNRDYNGRRTEEVIRSAQAPMQGGESWSMNDGAIESEHQYSSTLDYLRLDEMRLKEDELARARLKLAAKDMKNNSLQKRNNDLERKVQQYRQMLSKLEREKMQME